MKILPALAASWWVAKRASPIVLVALALKLFSFAIIDVDNIGLAACNSAKNCFQESWLETRPPPVPTAAGTTALTPPAPVAAPPKRVAPELFENRNAKPPLSEVYARHLFAGTFAMAVLSAIALGAYALTIVDRAVRSRTSTIGVAGIALLAGGVFAVVEFYFGTFDSALLRTLEPALRFVPTSEALKHVWADADGVTTVRFVRLIADFVAVMTLGLIVLAAASLTDKKIGGSGAAPQPAAPVNVPMPSPPIALAAPPLSPQSVSQARDLAQRITLLNRLLYGASAVLVLSIVALKAFTDWPLSLAGPNSELHKEMGLLGKTVLVSWGTIMSVLLVTMYASTAFWLDRQVERILTSNVEPERLEQRKKYGLTLGIRDHFTKTAVALLPLFASAVDVTLFKSLS
jgi:hypothetical protein